MGVLPRSFVWTTPDLDLIVPLAPDAAAERSDHRLLAFGVLKPGVALQQATADMQTIAAQLSAQYPDSNRGWSVLLRSFYDWLVPVETRRMLLVFFAAVAFVLLIAAGNVANLTLARAAGRQKEISIRVALGAARARVLSQLLVESVLLALIGGAAGCAIALGATKALKTLAADVVPRLRVRDQSDKHGRQSIPQPVGLQFQRVPSPWESPSTSPLSQRVRSPNESPLPLGEEPVLERSEGIRVRAGPAEQRHEGQSH